MSIVQLPSGQTIAVFGMGTWYMGEQAAQRQTEIDALRYGIDLGINLIDTAEMYGSGGAEKVVAEAIRGQRDKVTIVSKVYPHNASRKKMISACESSLQRLQCDTIDLYLLHWPGSVPLDETFETFRYLRDSGKIRDFGISNFDHGDLQAIPVSEHSLLGTNQVLYNLAEREAEWAVLPWCRQRRIPVMAYCPLDQGGALLQNNTLQQVAEKHQATTAQIALAWLLHQEQVIVIPKSSHKQRIQENFAALEIKLSSTDLAELDQALPGPSRPVRLGMR